MQSRWCNWQGQTWPTLCTSSAKEAICSACFSTGEIWRASLNAPRAFWNSSTTAPCARCAVLTLMGIDGVLGSPLLFVLVVLPLRCCFECLQSPRVPTLGKSPFSPHEGFWCRRSTALSSPWVSNLGESTVKQTNRSFDRSRSKFADPRYRPRCRITKSVTVTTPYNRTILSGTAASAQYKMAKAALHLKKVLNLTVCGESLKKVLNFCQPQTPCRQQGPFKTNRSKVNELVAWNRLFFVLRSGSSLSLSFSPSLSIVLLRQTTTACMRWEDLSARARQPQPSQLRWAKVQRRVQCCIRLLELRDRNRSVAIRSRTVRRVLTSSFRRPLVRLVRLEVEVPLLALFLSVILLCVSSSFFSRYLTTVNAHMLFQWTSSPYASAQPCVFSRSSGERSQGRTSLATESGLGESGKTFHIEEKKPAALLGRARSKAWERLMSFSFLRRVQFDNQILTQSERPASPVTMTTPWPCCDYRTRGALKLPSMWYCRWAIFLRTSSWNFENVLWVNRTSGHSIQEEIVSELWQVGMHASLSASFPDGLRKSNKVCVFGAESTQHF